MSYKTIEYKTWQQFKKDYCDDLYKGEFEPNKYLFRGQSNATWGLETSFDRLYSHVPYSQRKDIENELIAIFCTNCARHINSKYEISNLPEIEKRSMAQHYGVPTRLLDWSYSPFIAAYFAFSTVNYNKRPSHVAIWALLKEHEIWNSNQGVQIEEHIVIDNEHQKKQLGCFTILNNQVKSINKYVESCMQNGQDVEGALTQIIIPAEQFKAALHELEAMNINASTIYGGYEGCAIAARDAVALKYLFEK
ncbi:MAG: FRG domain-containing protein [Clostridia bacterium]|nr:FRG domain-containing protein [Clostridia bacterium]